MKSRWSDEEAPQGDDLDVLVYVSRLLGADPSLVLAGGGNSSVKTTGVDLYGEPLDVLHVKGSGWDMATIERAGFTPLRLDPVERLAELPELSDGRMADELRAASLDGRAPAPSVESILHATLPHRFVLHTHADALLALTNTPGGPALVEEVFGDDVVVVPYVMPGFALARLCAELFPARRHEGTIGMVLLNHGLFTFAYDARTAYENHIDLVARALARVEAPAAGLPGTGPRPDAADAPSLVAGQPATAPSPAVAPGGDDGPPPPADAPDGPDTGPAGRDAGSATEDAGSPGQAAAAGEQPDTAPGTPTAAVDPIGDDLDVAAFGAGDPSAFGAGAGVPGGAARDGGATTAVAAPGGDTVARTTTGPLAGAGRAVPVVLDGDLGAVAMLRRDISAAAAQPVIVRSDAGEAARRFAARDDLAAVAQVGPATPDHVLRTKPVPLIGRDVAGYVRDYEAYVARHRSRLGDRPLVTVDPAPRVVVDPELGVLAVGRQAADAALAADIYRHTMWVIERAVELGGYTAVGEGDLFDVEYWELEQAKLTRRPATPPLAGHVAVVTGAASGIGLATSRALLAAGAAVVGLDLDAGVDEVADGPAYVGVRGDVADETAVAATVEAAVRSFGGLDALVLNAGVFPPPEPLATLSPETWRGAMAVNTDAAVAVLQAAHPFLRVSPVGGSVVVVASKNVAAPGPGAAAYSASKAALTQVARVAALEWGADGIRVNVVHPDAVFDTGLWTESLIAERASSYGLTPEQYRTRNVLGAEVRAAHVADAVVAFCGPTFARTTGAQIAVDGGNDRVI